MVAFTRSALPAAVILGASVIGVGAAGPAVADPVDGRVLTVQQATYDESTLRSFAVALAEVQEIAAEWRPQIESAAPEQAESMRAQANAEMVEAVERNALNVETYNDIWQAAEADPQLRAQIEGFMSEGQ